MTSLAKHSRNIAKGFMCNIWKSESNLNLTNKNWNPITREIFSLQIVEHNNVPRDCATNNCITGKKSNFLSTKVLNVKVFYIYFLIDTYVRWRGKLLLTLTMFSKHRGKRFTSPRLCLFIHWSIIVNCPRHKAPEQCEWQWMFNVKCRAMKKKG